MGAKQNRVINTTVLLREQSETIIPVSCTEQGRWRFTSPHFEDSNFIMARKARSRKSRSVSDSLKSSGNARSDQSQVWEDISRLEARLGTRSGTSAMRDSYKRCETPLRELLSEFPCLENQTGLIALTDGEVIGMDLLSSASSYKQIHEKLVKSYVIDLLGSAVVENESEQEPIAREFLGQLSSLTESVHPSVGYGTDLRYQSDKYCGSALVHEEALVHAAFFVETKASSGRKHNPFLFAD